MQDIIVSLIGAGVDAASITRDDLGTYTLTTPDGRIAFASEPLAGDSDAQWWNATRYDTDGGEALVFAGPDTDALIRTLAGAYSRTDRRTQTINDNDNATTEYGKWDATVDCNTMTARHAVAELLADFAHDYDIEALGDAYAAAINAALPRSVEMCGEQFYGPWRPAPDAWAGYPTVDGRLDIKAIVEGVDFWRLARGYERGATVYVTIEAGSEDSPGRFIWQLLTDVERMDQEDDMGFTAVDLADVVAGNQQVADGDLWRVRVWAGPDEFEAHAVPLAEHLHDARNAS